MDEEDILIAKLQEANRLLRIELNETNNQEMISRDELKENHMKVEYLTGFPNYNLLENIFHEVEPCMADEFPGSAQKLTKFDVFLFTLIKLKLDLPLSYLSIQYAVEFETISILFRETIMILKKVLSRFVFWPKIKTSIKNSSKYHKIFGENRRIFIIQTFEVYCERPGHFVPQSDGQRYNTIKFMIAYSSAGHIIYISKSFGGWSTDTFVVENCGFLQLICTNDVILWVGSNYGEKSDIVACSKTTENSFKLAAITVTNSKEFANLTIDIKKVTSKLRQKISIMTKKQRIVNSKDTNTFLEYIMQIICAITNLYHSWTLELV